MLKNVCTGEKVRNLSDIVGCKILIVVSAVYAVLYLIIGKVCKEKSEYLVSSFGIRHIAQRHYLFFGELREIFGNKKSAVRRKAL